MKMIKTVILIIIGYIIFILMMAGFESIVTTRLGMETSILSNIKENTHITLKTYLIINLVFWGINCILNKPRK